MTRTFLLALLAAAGLSRAAHSQTQHFGPLEAQNSLSELASNASAALANLGGLPKTGGALTGPLYSPQTNGVKFITGIATDCSADAQPVVQAAVNAAYLGTYRKIVLPDGCIGFAETLLIDGPTAWTRAANRSIELSGAGREITKVTALGTMTALIDKGPHYTEGGGFHHFSIDGAALAQFPLRVEQSAEMDIGDLIIKNAAVGGAPFKIGQGSGDVDPLSSTNALATTTYAGQSTIHDITIMGLQSSDYRIAANMPNYGIWAASTDVHYSNIIASNAKISPIFEDPFSGGNKWDQNHSYGYGPYTAFGTSTEAQQHLISWFPEYCFIAGGLGSKWAQNGCDGATVAGADLRAWQIDFHDGNFGWAPEATPSGNNSTVGSARGILIENGVGDFVVHDNSFLQVPSASAIGFVGTPASGGHIYANTGASLNWGDVAADNLQFNAGFGAIRTPNGYAASYSVPAGATRYPCFNAATGSGYPQIVGCSTTPGDNVDLQLVPGGSGNIDLLGQVNVQSLYASGSIGASGNITASGGLSGSGVSINALSGNLSTSGGIVASLYAPAGATYRVSLNASLSSAHPQLAAVSSTPSDIVPFEITTQNGGPVLLNGGIAGRVVSPPLLPTSPCSIGDMSTYQSNFLYICVATNSWARIAQTTSWP
jgi:hypothetical protein